MLKTLSKFTFYLLFSFLILLFMIPVVISTKPGQKQFFKLISATSNIQIEADELILDWFGPQKAKHLHVKGEFIDIYYHEIDIPDSLCRFLLQKCRFKKIHIDHPDGVIRQSGTKGNFIFLPFSELIVKKGNIHFQAIDKIYKFHPFDLQVKLGKTVEIQTEGTLALGLNASSFKSIIHLEQSIVKKALIHVNLLPIEIFKDLLHIDFQQALKELSHQPINVDIDFDRNAKKLHLLVKNDQILINYPDKDLSKIFCSLKLPSGKAQLIGKEIELNFENLYESQGIFDIQIPSLELFSYHLKNIQALVTSKANEKIVIHSNFGLKNQFLDGSLNLLAECKKDASQALISLNNSSLSIKDPITQKWEPISKLETCILNYEQRQWKGKISLKEKASSPISFDCEFETGLVKNIMQIPQNLLIHLNSSFLTTKLNLKLSPTIELTSDAYFSIHPTIQQLNTLLPSLSLKKPFSINGMIENRSSLHEINGIFNIPKIEASIDNAPYELSLDKGTFSLEPKNFSGELYANLRTQEGLCAIDYNQESLLDSKCKIKLSKFPSSFIQLLYPIDPLIKQFIGSNLTGSCSLTKRKTTKTLDVAIQSEKSSAKLTADIDDDFITLKKPAKIHLHLKNTDKTPWFNQNQILVISEPRVNFELQELRLPKQLIFSDLVVDGKFSIENLKLSNHNQIAAIDLLRGECKKKQDSALKSYIYSESIACKIDTSISIEKVRLSPFYEMIPSLHGTIDVAIKEISSLFLNAALSPFIEEKFLNLVGENSNLFFHFDTLQYPKTLNCTLDSQHVFLEADGQLEGSDFILKKPLKMNLIPNQAFKDLFLLFTGISLINTKAPIVLECSPKGFILPLNPISLKTIQVPFMTLDLGQVEVSNSGTMGLTQDFFKKNLSNKISLWFTPIDASIKNGQFQLQRFDVLVQKNIPIAFWGKIDFKKEYVDCILGLTAQSLKNTLGIKNLPPQFVLTIPVRGKFDQVKIEKAQGLTKIAALIASVQRFTGKLGGILDLMNQMMNDQGTIPKPKRAFPWENSTSLDLKSKKELLLKFKNKYKGEELVSYSLSLDPIIHMIQDQIEAISATETEESQSVDNPNKSPPKHTLN